MDPPPKSASGQTSLFQVYLRLRPPPQAQTPSQQKPEPWLIVEPPWSHSEALADTNAPAAPTHITLQPPNDSRKRAVEKFAFTKVFEEGASQFDVFQGTGMPQLVQGVLAEGRDGLVATLGVTGSGKSHTILGSRSQRGITQMTLDVLFRSLSNNLCRPDDPTRPPNPRFLHSLSVSDSSEAQVCSAQQFLESLYGDLDRGRTSRAQTPMVGSNSRAQTPMTVWQSSQSIPGSFPMSPPSFVSDPALGIYPRLTPTAGVNPIPSLALRERGSITPTIKVVPASPPQNMSPSKGSPSRSRFLPNEFPFWNPKERITKKVTNAKFGQLQESIPTTNILRRHPPPPPSALPQVPDVSDLATRVDPDAEFAVLVSMYEVYNDRIFDLLSSPVANNPSQPTTRQGLALQKDLRRRPLLFKSTEASPDRKVVAGLRKVVCGTYEEAMMVLETGLVERRVAGTGSNSVSSRSHGFFCVEVRRKARSGGYGGASWNGSTLTVVDLAGSERARNAKTAGATLAEAGKINESLMYLGQCLQMQSDYHDGAKPTLVPFRQCKLTELLFSNSLAPHSQQGYKTPQKSVMIVTADPLGDFNATSQILRYSALAREVTVPRIPSTTSEILAGSMHKAGFANGRASPSHALLSDELESAVVEIARLGDECDSLSVRLAEEEIKRTEAEMKYQAAEDRCLLIEQEVREECWAEMEQRMEQEMRRWRAAWEGEGEKAEEHLDKKLEILSRGVLVHEDPEPTNDHRVDELERENDVLRAKIALLEQESQTRSPTKPKKSVLGDRSSSLENSTEIRKVSRKLQACTLTDQNPALSRTAAKSPGKKIRKLTTRKWDLGAEEELDD